MAADGPWEVSIQNNLKKSIFRNLQNSVTINIVIILHKEGFF